MGYAEFERLANDRVEDLLEAYAQARLDPNGPVLSRIRANVMAHAAASAAARVLDTPTLAPAKPRFAWLQAPLPRRAFALGLAATLTFGTTAAVLAAPPGSPFYNARLVIETVLLPTELDARLAAYEAHLEQRLREAEAAAVSGDTGALAAALAAYESDVTAALGAVGDDAELLAHLEAMLAKHTTVLMDLEARLPEQASVDKAIANSQKAIQKIKDKAAGGGTNGGSGGGPSNGPGGPPDGPPDNPGPP
jgi:Domain of unknown function (DUF5667)